MYSEFLENLCCIQCDYESAVKIVVLLIGLILIYLYFSCNTTCARLAKCIVRVVSIVSLLVLLYLFFCSTAVLFKPTLLLFVALLFLINIFTFASTTVLDAKCPSVYCCDSSFSCFSKSSCAGCNFA